MAIKEAKSLELLPRLTVNEKKVYVALANHLLLQAESPKAECLLL